MSLVPTPVSWITTSEMPVKESRDFGNVEEKSQEAMPSNWYPSAVSFQTPTRRFDDFNEELDNPISSAWHSAPRKSTPKSSHYKSNEIEEGRSDTSSWFEFLNGAEYSVVKGVLIDCLKDDILFCLKKKALGLMDRARKMRSIRLTEGLSYVRIDDGGLQDSSENETDTAANLARDLNQKNNTLNELLLDHFVKFWKSHTLVVDDSSDDFDGGM